MEGGKVEGDREGVGRGEREKEREKGEREMGIHWNIIYSVR